MFEVKKPLKTLWGQIY